MAQTIWKVALQVLDHQTVVLPAGAKFVHCGLQNDVVCLWYATKMPVEQYTDRHIEMYGTGHTIPPGEDRAYLGTVLMRKDTFVLHVFERTS